MSRGEMLQAVCTVIRVPSGFSLHCYQLFTHRLGQKKLFEIELIICKIEYYFSSHFRYIYISITSSENNFPYNTIIINSKY